MGTCSSTMLYLGGIYLYFPWDVLFFQNLEMLVFNQFWKISVIFFNITFLYSLFSPFGTLFVLNRFWKISVVFSSIASLYSLFSPLGTLFVNIYIGYFSFPSALIIPSLSIFLSLCFILGNFISWSFQSSVLSSDRIILPFGTSFKILILLTIFYKQ